MFTSMDKAISAFIMSVLYMLNSVFGFVLPWDEETISALVVAIIPVIVYFMPEKEKKPRRPGNEAGS